MTAADDQWPRSVLRCPVCHGRLADGEAPPELGGGPELRCVGECGRAYPVDDGVPVLLATEARLP